MESYIALCIDTLLLLTVLTAADSVEFCKDGKSEIAVTLTEFGQEKLISNLQYPAPYTDESNCTMYLIVAPNAPHVVHIKELHTFCPVPYSIVDQNDEEFPYQYPRCLSDGYQTYFVYNNSTFTVMKLKVGSESDQRFNFTAAVLPLMPMEPINTTLNLTTTPTAYITSHQGFPESTYSNNLHNKLTLSDIPSGYDMFFEFIYMKLGHYPFCQTRHSGSDMLLISNDEDGSILYQCADIDSPKPFSLTVNSSQVTMILEFITNGTDGYDGFLLHYSVVGYSPTTMNETAEMPNESQTPNEVTEKVEERSVDTLSVSIGAGIGAAIGAILGMIGFLGALLICERWWCDCNEEKKASAATDSVLWRELHEVLPPPPGRPDEPEVIEHIHDGWETEENRLRAAMIEDMRRLRSEFKTRKAADKIIRRPKMPLPDPDEDDDDNEDMNLLGASSITPTTAHSGFSKEAESLQLKKRHIPQSSGEVDVHFSASNTNERIINNKGVEGQAHPYLNLIPKYKPKATADPLSTQDERIINNKGVEGQAHPYLNPIPKYKPKATADPLSTQDEKIINNKRVEGQAHPYLTPIPKYKPKATANPLSTLRNNEGPRIDPCGTPQVISRGPAKGLLTQTGLVLWKRSPECRRRSC